MNDDELRRRLKAADPVTATPPADSWIPDLVEATMNTPNQPENRGRSWLPAVAAAALVAVLGVGTYVVLDDDKGNTQPAEPATMSLALPGAEQSMQMCMAFEVNVLKVMPVAFSGTASSVDADSVTLTVDRWYKGGDADQVLLTNNNGAEQVALDGISFEQGQRYLVTATDDTVNVCGYSGAWSQDLADKFDEAFGS